MGKLKTCAITIVSTLIFHWAAQAGTLGSWQLYGWTVGAYSDDQTGKFGFCSAETAYNSGIGLMFSIHADGKWAMSFAHPAWQLTEQAVYPLQYEIDSGPMLSGRGTAVTKTLVLVPLEDSAVLFQMFKQGRQLKVFAAGQTFAFNLTNTSKVLEGVAGCWRQNQQPPNPFAPSPAPAAPPDSSQYRAEAATVVANVLSLSGIQGFAIADTAPDNLKSYLVVWTAPGLIGGVQILDHASVEQAASEISAADTGTCKGTLGTLKLPSSASGAARMRSVCEESGKNGFRINYSIVPRSRGGVYVLSTGETDAGQSNAQQPSREAAADDAGGRLFEASMRWLEPK
jgi:hypothetical protein